MSNNEEIIKWMMEIIYDKDIYKYDSNNYYADNIFAPNYEYNETTRDEILEIENIYLLDIDPLYLDLIEQFEFD